MAAFVATWSSTASDRALRRPCSSTGGRPCRSAGSRRDSGWREYAARVHRRPLQRCQDMPFQRMSPTFGLPRTTWPSALMTSWFRGTRQVCNRRWLAQLVSAEQCRGSSGRCTSGRSAPTASVGAALARHPVKPEEQAHNEGPALPSTWVTGTSVRRAMRCGRSMTNHRDSRRGRVETTTPSKCSS